MSPELRDNLGQAAQRLAACPHSTTCGAEFKRNCSTNRNEAILAARPSPFFVGSRYRGLLVVGANPGLAHTTAQHDNDRRMFDLQDRIAVGDATAFEELMTLLPASMLKWGQVVNATGRERLKFDIEDIAYINIVSCGSNPAGSNPRSRFRNTGILDRCWNSHAKMLIDLLAPTHVVGLWKPIIGELKRLGFDFGGKHAGYHSGARHEPAEKKYAPAQPVFDAYYGRRVE